MVTDDGMAHPVTRELPGRNQDKTPPTWGRWFRIDRRQQDRRPDRDERTARAARFWCWTVSARAGWRN